MLLLLGEKRHGIERHRRRARVQLSVRRGEVILQVVDVELLQVAGEHGELLVEERGDEQRDGIVGVARRRWC